MDWKNIKTIFIFTFLLLNLYLGTEFYNKVNPDLDILNEETQKKVNEIIDYSKSLPKIEKKLFITTGTVKEFTDEDIKEFTNHNSNQEINLGPTNEGEDKRIISAILNSPYPFTPDSEVKGQLEQFVENYIPNGEQYKYWKYDEERNIYIFTQHLDGIQFYFENYIADNNLTGMIEIYVDSQSKDQNESKTSKHQITSYRLTQMELNKEQEVKKFLTAEEALLVPDIKPRTTLEDIKLLYFTSINNESIKVFVPNWYIVTESDEWMVDVTDSNDIKLDQENEEESEVE
ncbi:two-component system regulatory protein YycI [Pseudalkalibacillus sp. Hm43]|uniref:two-component system regulatory protein YycI n=1 Tax=Pseudalkalibacillus sp. Hm43 TaxID=3450742 RepID=UPI003F42219D